VNSWHRLQAEGEGDKQRIKLAGIKSVWIPKLNVDISTGQELNLSNYTPVVLRPRVHTFWEPGKSKKKFSNTSFLKAQGV